MEQKIKSEKLTFRETRENVMAIKRAANIKRMSYTDFMSETCLKEAFKVLEEVK